MDKYHEKSRDYQRVEAALDYLARHFRHQPELAEVAASAHLSEYHFQRLFSRWVGVSPKKFMQYLTLDYAKRCLDDSASVLDASVAAGLSGSSRLHDLFVKVEALSPGEYKRRGEGMRIDYGFHDTPFGEALVLASSRGMTGLAFVESSGREAALEDMRQRLPAATYHELPASTVGYAQQLCNRMIESGSGIDTDCGPLRILLAGTPFQLQVWQALLRVPAGCRVTYQQVARLLGKPDAVRAVGTAVGRNPVSWLIPCHRVLRRDGYLGGYHWGEARKLAMLGWESASLTEFTGEIQRGN